MSQQGPIIVVSTAGRPPFAAALEDAKLVPITDAAWGDAARAVARLQPGAVLVEMSGTVEPAFAALAELVAARQPYLPLIAVDPTTMLPENAMPFSSSGGRFDRLAARLSAALRVRSLHATVMRRLEDQPAARSDTDPVRDATVLLIGRGAAYPALSVALGERMGIVGALSIEAAAKHLNVRDVNGIVLGEGFSPRVMDAFLTVLAEDARFRNLPVVVTSDELAPDYGLPNLEIISGSPSHIAANASPLIRQHAFEARLSRTPGGPRTSDFATAIYQTQSCGGGLSVARFAFDPDHPRAQLDGGRILSRLMRRMDFGNCPQRWIRGRGICPCRFAYRPHDRAAALQRDAPHQPRPGDLRTEPVVTVASMQPSDLQNPCSRAAQTRRAAS